MVRSVEGVFRNGKVELTEPPPVAGEARVIVTFLPERKLALLSDYGITPEQAAEARARLASFEEDWMLPEMDVYDAL